MEVKEEYGLDVHAIITVEDIYEYLKQQQYDSEILNRMQHYMNQYCVL